MTLSDTATSVTTEPMTGEGMTGEIPRRRSPEPFHWTRPLTEFVIAVAIGIAAVAMMSFSTNSQDSVNSQLAAAGIHFPAAGSPQFSPALFPTVQQYAGQLVDSGTKAEAYANGYITPQLAALTGGQTPFAVSQAAAADPTNAPLQAEANAVFQASTTRGLLLTTWGLSRIATYTLYGAIALAVAFAILMALALFELVRARRPQERGSATSFRHTQHGQQSMSMGSSTSN